jgi:hypothetical protein
MRRKEFIDLILNSISNQFDIYHNYRFENHKFVIYAYCYNRHNKFKSDEHESRLWEMKSFEHLFFINSDNLDVAQLEELKNFAIQRIEPHFVRGDGKSPVKNHLYTYITFIIITRNLPSQEVLDAIEHLSWNKNYLLSAKGYTSLRMVCVTPRQYHVSANKTAKDMKDFLTEILLHIDHYEE